MDLKPLKQYLSKRRKAIAGFITPGVSYVLVHVGLGADAGLAAAISSALTLLVVNRIPNDV